MSIHSLTEFGKYGLEKQVSNISCGNRRCGGCLTAFSGYWPGERAGRPAVENGIGVLLL